MKILRFNRRRSWFVGGSYSSRFAVEVAGFDCNPSMGIQVDGPDRELKLHLCFGIGLYLTTPWPRQWCPTRYSETYGSLPEKREVEMSFSHWTLRWSLWMIWGEWNSTDPKWRSGHIDFDRLFFGKHTCEFTNVRTENHLVNFIEGNYRVVVTEKKRVDSWPRWFTRTSVCYEVEATPKPIPVEGKGENSWDCGETFTSSSQFPARQCKDCYDAALYFEKHMKEQRRKYGGATWTPRSHRTTETKMA